MDPALTQDSRNPDPRAALDNLEDQQPQASHDLGQPESATFSTLEELITHLQTFAKEHGFALVRSTLRRRDTDKVPILLNLLCDRHGHLRNHRGLTEETRVRKKRKSRGIGCTYRISCTLRQDKSRPRAGQIEPVATTVTPNTAVNPQEHAQQSAPGAGEGQGPSTETQNGLLARPTEGGGPQQEASAQPPQVGPTQNGPDIPRAVEPEWIFKVTSTHHNHTADYTDAEPHHWKHRAITKEDMRRIRQWYCDGKSPREMLDLIKEDEPRTLYLLKDIQNARRRAQVQFGNYLEGRSPG